MSISTATDDRTDGDDDTSQESQPKEDSSESENGNENMNDTQNQNGGVQSPEVHEITSDDEEDCVVTNEDESSNSSGSSNGSTEGSQHSNKDTEHKNIQEEQLENGDEEESDIEEVTIEDPLNQVQEKNKPIVINDTKNLVELAKKQASSGDSKEPTVVIIDTNSILSGKGPIPVQNKQISNALEAQNLCQSIAARGTTITPVSCKVTSSNVPPAPQPNILPSLTDDMFVVEAPSFIVPYVYEKPSVKPFREFVDKLGKELEEIKLKEDQIKLEKEIAEKERKEKERQERIARGESVEDVDAIEKAKQEKKEKKQKRQNPDDDDDSWDGESSSDSEGSDDMLILKDKSDPMGFQDPFNLSGKSITGKADSYFDCSLGQFFINIGLNLVQEFVQSDLVKQQSRKLYKEKKAGRNTDDTQAAIASLSQNLAHSRRLNASLRLELRRCEFCSFRTESRLVMAHHLEAPHMRSNIYRCNSCPFEIRSPHDILYHMEAAHARRGRLERAPAYQQCANCHFEDNSKTKLARHLLACAKKFKPELNLSPPLEWEPPAKIPKVARARPPGYPMVGGPRLAPGPGRPALPPQLPMPGRGRGRPPLSGISRPPAPAQPIAGVPIVRGGVVIMHNAAGAGPNYPAPAPATPKISITPLPRAPQPSSSHSKATFVICEICDGYIKDLEQLRNHMQWIHKVKIHPKMIYNRPPLNCQKCQFRFFTDQGLERHLLGSHGLVTSAMQEAANRGKDAGRCPVCGRVYQWKLLAHVARDHGVALKPAHLSYKCTVCTATFGMYKQFESHVYSAHSVAQRRRPEPRPEPRPPALTGEVSIVPTPAKPPPLNHK